MIIRWSQDGDKMIIRWSWDDYSFDVKMTTEWSKEDDEINIQLR